MTNIAQIRAREQKNKSRFLALNPKLTEESGIYILFREENGIKFAYVGQAKHILTRLAQHLVGYQHIDLSLKKHGLATEKENGWKVHFETCSLSALDEAERSWIKYMADKGYQLRNKTLGGQDEGKFGLDNQKPSRGYRDGLEQGRKSLARELKHIIDTHLEIKLRKEDNKISQKALAKFWELLESEEKE
jgi:uncharacterized protein YifE (UPF0438 family)